MATWSYDAADPGSVTATFPTTPGHTYTLFCDDPDSSQVLGSATGSSLTLTVTGIHGMDNTENFFAYVFRDSDGQYKVVAAVLFRFTGGLIQDVISFEYDGANTITIHVPTEVGGSYFFQGVSGSSASFTGDGTVMTRTIDLSPSGAVVGDTLLLWGSREDDPGLAGWSDGVSDVIVYGTPLSVVGSLDWHEGITPPPPPEPPTNNSCGTAQVITGCSGTIEADNRLWDGVWPTGNDPLFNANGEGGGAPLWYKWTNHDRENLLFRVTISSPPDHPVDYNFGMNIGTDCSSLVFINDGSTLDIGLGPGCYFDNNREGGSYDDYEVGDDFGPEFTTSFDVIVAPGHSVYIEIDSYTGIATEPPVADSSHRGKFKLDWAALTFTTQDKLEGSGFDCEPHTTDASGLIQTVWRTDGTDTAHGITPRNTVRVGDRLYLMWAYESDDNGTSWYAGDCALDGSDLHFQRYIDRHGAANQYPILQTPRLFTNGTDVFIGFAWREFVSAYKNPDYLDSCDNHTGEVFVCFECSLGMNQWRYSILKFNSGAHTWDEVMSIGENAPFSAFPKFVPDFGNIHGDDTGFFKSAICATATEIWFIASYTPSRKVQSLHRNDFPTTETPSGALYCTSDSEFVSAVVDVFKFEIALLDDSGAGWTLESRDILELYEYQHWVSDNPSINPVFGAWQVFADGDFFTDPPGTTYPTNQFEALDMTGEEGYPILAYSYLVNTNTISNDVIVKRLDTGTIIQDWAYSDITLGFDATAHQAIAVNIANRYTNPNTGLLERGFKVGYNGGAKWLVRVKSDFSAAPSYVIDGDPSSSDPSFLENNIFSFFPDKKLGQWWCTGLNSSSPFSGLFLYDLCNPGWHNSYASLTDGFTQNLPISKTIYYDKTDDQMWFLHGSNNLRLADVLRDFLICVPGEPCSACPPSILWFRVGGIWRQKNVDTEYTLWHHINGEWINDCDSLTGQLQGAWQS